ncbi:MAG TPA: HD domain-containing protein [Syntrophomonadaceae bacterium]|nr:HD domain-containing protein [Syntrophomonadaceae bacterium]
MHLPSYVLEVIHTLKSNNKEAFLVGGCVRDLLMNREPVDYDVATSASTAEIVSIFPKTVPIGARYGTVAVMIGDHSLEVSTFKGQEDAITDTQVGLEQDLLLRDFTINAIGMDDLEVIFDPYGGREDLENRILRAPRNQAEERLKEDPLRMLRAVRFACVLDLSLHPTIVHGIQNNADLISTVAAERVRVEFDHILTSDRSARGLRLLAETGLLEHFLPEVAAMVNFDQRNFRHDKDVFEHSLAVLESVPPRIRVRLAALLHDVGKTATFTVDKKGVGHFYGHHEEGRKMTETILRRLRYDNQTIEDVSILVIEHMSRFAGLKGANLKKLLKRVGEDNLYDLYDLQRADILGSAPPFDFSALDAMQEEIARILCEEPPLNIKDLAIDGDDLIALGYCPGPQLGSVLNSLLEVVLDNPDKNERFFLINMAREQMGSQQ